MSWSGSGTFDRIFSWIADKTAGIDISSSRMDTDTDDIVSNGFGNCLTRDGQGFATADLPMDSFRHTGVGDGQARTDYASLGQSQDGTVNWVAAGGSADALTATYSPAVTALVDGQLFFVRAGAANATSTPTFQANSTTAHTITKFGGMALAEGDIAGDLAEIILRYDLANTRFELLNPTFGPASATANNIATFADTTGQKLSDSGISITSAKTKDIDITFDGGGSVLTAITSAGIHIPFPMTITKWWIAADQSGSVSVDILRANNAVPSSSIVGSGTKPNLSSAQFGDAAPSSWTATTLAKDDFIAFEITGTPSSVTRINVTLTCTLSS